MSIKIELARSIYSNLNNLFDGNVNNLLSKEFDNRYHIKRFVEIHFEDQSKLIHIARLFDTEEELNNCIFEEHIQAKSYKLILINQSTSYLNLLKLKLL